MIIRVLLLLITLFVMAACSPEINEFSVQASPEAPIAAQVRSVSIPRNLANEKVYFVIQPVRVREEGVRKVTTISSAVNTGAGNAEQIGGQTQLISSEFRNYLLQRQRQITLQLASAISGVKDFGLIDYDAFHANPEQAKRISPSGKIYLVRAVITEISNNVVEKKSKIWIPLVTKGAKGLVQSKVALDVSATEVSTGEVAHAFATNGSYVTKTASTKAGFIANFYKADVSVRSTIDQAIRVALNSASERLHQEFYGSGSSN